MRFRTNFAALTGNEILRDVARLVSGTLGGRLIVLAALPLVTRLYSPADFALLAVYLALVGLISVIACLRFDIAIPVVADEAEAMHLLMLALGFALVTSFIVLALVFTLSEPVSAALGQPDLLPFLWLVPLGILMSASYSALQFWTTRTRRFGVIAVTRVTQAASGTAVMLSLGWAGIAPLGLLLGNMVNLGAGSLRLVRDLLRQEPKFTARIRPAGLRATFHANRRFPIYSTPEALANIAGTQLPVLIIAAHAGTEAGHLLLAMQFMALPMGLLGQSISQVYISRAPLEYRAGTLTTFTLSVMRHLVVVGLGPLVLVGSVAPLIVPWLFGPDWVRTGEIITWMVPWMAMQFIVSPVSMVMHVVGRQRAMLALTTIGLVQRVGAVGLALSSALYGMVQGLVLGSVAYYLTMLIFILAAAGGGARHYLFLLKAFLDWRVLAPVTLAVTIYLMTW